MKGLYVALIAAGTGIVGFLIGGGFGVYGGLVGGGTAGVLAGATAGMCTTVETAVTEGILTAVEVEQLGNRIGQTLHQSDPKLATTVLNLVPDRASMNTMNVSLGDSSPVCETFLVQMRQGVQSSR